MGDAKEKRERDTLLYYIRGICRGGRKGCVLRKGGKECLREGIAEKNRDLEENWRGRNGN